MVGSVSLFSGVPTPWLGVVGGCIAVIAFMYIAMPTMTRTRFSTPTISREWLVGQTGSSVDRLGPDGVVRVARRPVARHQ